MDNDLVYKINVSGKIYDIKYKTLIKIPYFLEYIDDNNKGLTCFVERSSMIFDHVLAYVIDHLHPYPSKYFYELDFYGLIYNKDIYKVNMLGKIYHIKRDILMKIPYFIKRINDINNSSVEIFVERSPLLFDQILAYLMDNNYPLEYYSELDYYGITYNRYRLSKTDLCLAKDSIERETDKILSNLRDMYEDVTKIHTKLDEIKTGDTIEKKQCECSMCGDHFDVDENYSGNYCNNHSECRYCDSYAHRHNNYLCNMHQ